MAGEELAFAGLAAAARDSGIAMFVEIQLAVLEPNGQISFFTADGARDGAPA